jgi:hypothetical protein
VGAEALVKEVAAAESPEMVDLAQQEQAAAVVAEHEEQGETLAALAAALAVVEP